MNGACLQCYCYFFFRRIYWSIRFQIEFLRLTFWMHTVCMRISFWLFLIWKQILILSLPLSILLVICLKFNLFYFFIFLPIKKKIYNFLREHHLMHYLSNNKVQVFLNLNSRQYIDSLDKIKGKQGNVSMLYILTFQKGLHFGIY